MSSPDQYTTPVKPKKERKCPDAPRRHPVNDSDDEGDANGEGVQLYQTPCSNALSSLTIRMLASSQTGVSDTDPIKSNAQNK